MKTNSRLSIAVHAMILIYLMEDDIKITGDLIAKSEMLNPVSVRGVLSSLKKAGIIDITVGKGGTHTLKAPEEVTLYDLFSAVNTGSNKQIMGFHDCERSSCPIADNMHDVLDKHFLDAEEMVKKSLASVTMKDIIDDMQDNYGVDKGKILYALKK